MATDPHGTSFTGIKDARANNDGSRSLSPRYQKAMQRDRERPLHNTKVKPELQWRHQDIKDAKTVGYLLRPDMLSSP